MVIISANNLGKGICFIIKHKNEQYMLLINETGKSWFDLDSDNGFAIAYTGISDEKKIKKLERAFKKVVYLPQ